MGLQNKVEKPSLSVVIPVFRSQTLLPKLVRRLEPVLKNTASRYEVIFIDDGSPDDSWKVVKALSEKHDWIRGISLMSNFGQHNALLCGIREATCDFVVTMDDDLQHPPEEIPKLINALTPDCDVVYGLSDEPEHHAWRNLSSKLTKLLLRAAFRIHGVQNVGAFRAFRTSVRDSASRHHGPYINIDVLLTWSTRRISSVRVNHDPRPSGSSNYNFLKLVRHAFNMITGYSAAPLRIASVVGFVFTFFGIGVLIYVVIRYFIHGVVVEGFAFLSSIIAILAGAQLFSLGIMGEYLARMHFRIMDKPTYVIRNQCGRRLEMRIPS